jgi:2-polyprenyl-3-methyl-5-hydroxy-6-metoxy-1,4-benzoquinol methylase
MVVFDVIVNGEVIETIKPKTQKLKAMVEMVKEQMVILKRKHGSNFIINRRFIY